MAAPAVAHGARRGTDVERGARANPDHMQTGLFPGAALLAKGSAAEPRMLRPGATLAQSGARFALTRLRAGLRQSGIVVFLQLPARLQRLRNNTAISSIFAAAMFFVGPGACASCFFLTSFLPWISYTTHSDSLITPPVTTFSCVPSCSPRT